MINRTFTCALLGLLAFPEIHAAEIERDLPVIVIEAESFEYQSKDDLRKWYVVDRNTAIADQAVEDAHRKRVSKASGNAYIEILPDTRLTHADVLKPGENFSEEPGALGVISYDVEFPQAGRFYVWLRGFSRGTEDNGVHVGLNGKWPDSGRRVQWCRGKNEWTWTSNQRRDSNHCGTPRTIWLDVPSAGSHRLELSMREDGVMLDRIILAANEWYSPSAYEIEFTPREADSAPVYYRDHLRDAWSIDPAQGQYHDQFASADAVYDGSGGTYRVTFHTIAEKDGESTYRLLVNGSLFCEFGNPEVPFEFAPHRFAQDGLNLTAGDRLTVQSNAHTNEKIPEGSGTAWARGRWTRVTLEPY